MAPDRSSNHEFPPLLARYEDGLLAEKTTPRLKPNRATFNTDPQMECPIRQIVLQDLHLEFRCCF